MSIFSNNKSENLFAFSNKTIQFGNKSINVVSGSNTLAGLSLCGVQLPYDNYQRLNIQIPAGAKDFVLAFPTLGIRPTFLSILPKYCGCNTAKQYLYWNFIHNTNSQNVMTNIMILTGTPTNPIPQIVITNPDDKNSVTIEILIASSGNDYLDDVTNYVYLGNLEYENVFIYDVGILGVTNQDNELFLTVDITSIINVTKVNGKNRIIIDDSTQYDIVLDFKTEEETYQILSSINYLINNPLTPQPPVPHTLPYDTDAPVISYYSPLPVNNMEITINLNDENENNPIKDFQGKFDKIDFIDYTIISCVDARDGLITLNPSHIKFIDLSDNVEIASILNAGEYKAIIEVNDIANNKTMEEILIHVEV